MRTSVFYKSIQWCCMLVFLHLLLSACGNNDRGFYPVAERTNFADTLHGKIIKDPYNWLEDLECEKTKEFAKVQDSVLTAYFNQSEEYANIKSNIDLLNKYDRYNFRNSFVLPEVSGNAFFYSKTKAGDSKSGLYFRTSLNGNELEIIPPDFDDANRELASFAPSPNGKILAYGTLDPSSPWVELRVSNVGNPLVTNETLNGFFLGCSLKWSPDNKGFYYIWYNQKEYDRNTKLGFPKVFYHKIGTDQKDDLLIFSKSGGTGSLTINTTSDGKHLILKDDFTFWIKSVDPDIVHFKKLISRSADYKLSFIDKHGDAFYFLSTQDAPRGKVIAMDFDDVKDNGKLIVPESEYTINAVVYNSGKLLLQSIRDVNQVFEVYDVKGDFLYNVDIPFIGSTYSFKPGLEGTNTIFYSLTNLFNPQSILQLDLKSGESHFFLRPKLQYDPDEYQMEQIFYKSYDGTTIPAFLSYKKGLKINGSNPAMIYAYGALGANTVSFYRPEVVEWLKMGGIYLNAAIRGGGEYGQEWWEAGRKLNKKTGILDYLSGAEWLVDHKYSDYSKLVASGGSLSGVLPAAAITQRPDMFTAAIIRVPVLDFVRFEHFDNSRSWVDEFGDPRIKEEFDALYSYSPYHQIKNNIRYPKVLIQCGEKDKIAHPSHAYKFTAALQNAQIEQKNPILLKTSWGAGHYSGGVTIEEQNETRAQIATFLFEEVIKNN